MPSLAIRPQVLIVDDDVQVRKLLKDYLQADNDCRDVSSGEEALSVLQANKIDLLLSDIQMPGLSGLELVPCVLEKSPDTIVIMISGEQTIESAIEAMRAGAFDYVMKPFDLRQVKVAVDRALNQHDLLVKKRQYEEHLEDLVKERTAELEHLAYYDRLTDLPNRNLFADRCEEALAVAQREEKMAGVLLVALDRFKKINETLGHAAGDIVIREAGERLQTCLRQCDTLARIEGDEFALLLPQIFYTEELADVSLAISEAFKSPFHPSGHELYVSPSIGIAVFPHNGDDAATILKNAGAALYRAKTLGGNNHQFFASEMNSQAVTRLALETDIRHGIENDQFVTYYQPVVDLLSAEIIGAEALVRWQHPEKGLLPPAQFISLAEDTGLILNIGDAVMRAACAQMRAWQQRGGARLNIAINVSARQLRQKHFLDQLIEILSETNTDPSCVELELTETTIMESTEVSIKILTAVRKLGIRVAIDDFGTGYSSLSYLKRLPIDTLKLDQSFVRGATSDPDDAALVMAIVTLAHNLKLKVIAEGIETNEQLSFLRLLRCDEGQGFLFGKPMPAEAFELLCATYQQEKGKVLSDLSPKRFPRNILASK